MNCNGPCNQGRLPCPTPEACQQPLNDGGMGLIGMLAIYVMGVATGVIGTLIIF